MKKLLFFAFAVFAFVACTQNDVEELSANRADVPETLTVGFEGGNDTRIQLNEAQKTVWTKDDLVSVFYRSNANQKWQYQGETGERVGNLKRVDAGTATESMKRVVVVYPYNENYYINTDTYNVQATLPATQHYLANSYGTDGNIMVSLSEYNQFSLKSVCGWLKLQLTGDGEVVKSIKFRGNDDEQVAGELYINSADATAMLASDMGGTDDNNAGGNLVFDDTILTEVVLDCGEGVALGAEATAFYISLPPQTFANGFTVDIECEDYELMTLTTEKELVIERNHIQPMESVVFEAQEIIPYNEIRYTATAKVEEDSYYSWSFDTFGANIVSHEWDSESGEGVITFDADVTTIGDFAFEYCDSLTSVTIPDSVTTIGNSVFYYCSSLTSVTIPDSVTTIGNGAFFYCDSLTNITIPDSVTTIGYGAFSVCGSLTEFNGKFASEDGRCLIVDGTLNSFAPAGLTSYTIPDSVTTIGKWAFHSCDSLTNITIPDSVTTIEYEAFAHSYGLTSITIGDSVTTIGGAAFRGCDSLTSVTIGDSVTTIGEAAFGSCDSLTSVTIPDSVTTIGEAAFGDCDSLTSVYCEATTPPILVGSYVFNNNASERKIYVPAESVEAYQSATNWSRYASAIVGYDFENGVVVEPEVNEANRKIHYTATAKTEAYSSYPWSFNTFGANVVSNEWDSESGEGVITFDANVTTIGKYAFYECRSLTSVTIPDSVRSIGYDAFLYCSSLTSVTIPDSVTTIGDQAFFGCSSLTSITIPDSVTTIGGSAFCNCKSLTSVTIPDSVTTIGGEAFSGCRSLTEFNGKFASVDGRCLIVDSTLNSFAIGCGATEYAIPDSVTTIGDSAFRNCDSLTSITIPDSVTTIGDYAFAYCDSLTSVYCEATTPPSLGGSDVFDYNASGRTIYVPTASVEAYKSATYWSEYKSAIVGYNFENGVVVE